MIPKQEYKNPKILISNWMEDQHQFTRESKVIDTRKELVQLGKPKFGSLVALEHVSGKYINEVKLDTEYTAFYLESKQKKETICFGDLVSFKLRDKFLSYENDLKMMEYNQNSLFQIISLSKLQLESLGAPINKYFCLKHVMSGKVLCALEKLCLMDMRRVKTQNLKFRFK